MRVAAILIFCLLVTALPVHAEPEPSLRYHLHQFFDGWGQAFSIGSSYQSFVRWNPSTDECIYWTGILHSVTSIVVEDKYCSKRTYTKTYTTIDSIDQDLLTRLNARESDGSSAGAGLGRIGDTCTSVTDCGRTCEGRGSTCEPRCLDGGQGKVCFAGEGSAQSGNLYSSVCGRDSDCERGQSCTAGICTLSEETGKQSGNPPIQQEDGSTRSSVTPEDICKTTDCTTKCSDGTPVFECASTAPKYCFLEGGKGVLKDYAGVCGCPEGQQVAADGLRCETATTAKETCDDGAVKVKDCPDGTEVAAVECVDGEWLITNALCPVLQEGEDYDIGALPSFSDAGQDDPQSEATKTSSEERSRMILLAVLVVLLFAVIIFWPRRKNSKSRK